MGFKFEKYGLGGGSGSGSGGFIDVPEFPTENVDTSSVYRTSETVSGETQVYIAHPVLGVGTYVDIAAMQGQTANTPTYVVESLPEVMEPFDSGTMTIPYYIIESTGVVYVSIDGTSSSAMTMGEMLGGAPDKGWADSVDGLDPKNNNDDVGVYCIRGKDSTIISYGVPGDVEIKSIKEYTTEDGWKTIINRVDAFPTENIEDEAVYQICKELDALLDVWIVKGNWSGNLFAYGAAYGLLITATYYLVDELPESPIVTTMDSWGGDFHVYIIRSTGEPFVLTTEGEACKPLVDSILNGASFNGIISVSTEASSEGLYTIMRDAYSYSSYGIPNTDGKNEIYEQTSDGTWKRWTKTVTRALEVTENGTYEVEDGVDGYSSVTVNVQPNLQEKSVTENGDVTPDEGYDGLSKVTVNIQPNLQEKTITASGTYNADAGYDGFGTIVVDINPRTIEDTYNALRVDAVMNGEDGGVNFARNANLSFKYGVNYESEIHVTGLTAKNFSSLYIPNGVTDLDKEAFSYGAYSTVVMCDSIKYLASGVFKYCSNLTDVQLPNNLTFIPDATFSYCTGLTTIPSHAGILSIGSSAFAGCHGLTDIAIPDSIQTISSNAFFNCSNLTRVVFPQSVLKINKEAFINCKSLEVCDFTAHTSVPTLGTDVFTATSSSFKIHVPDALYDEWITAENWSTYASNIVKASEVTT